jgi:hypothetical protein
MSWPGSDIFYNYNIPQAEARRSYYAVSYVPQIHFNGTTFGGSGYSAWENMISNLTGNNAPISIDLGGGYDWGSRQGFLDVDITSESGVEGEYRLYVVLIENDLYYPTSTHPGLHPKVMRSMLTGSTGQVVTLAPNNNESFQVNFDIPEIVVVENAQIVVFVQNHGTKEVLNASVTTIEAIGPINVPNLSYASSAVNVLNDDGDGKLNPGETGELTLYIANTCDWMDAADVTGTLSTDNEFVTITSASATFPNIVACDEVGNEINPFVFSISENAPPIMDIDFIVSLDANGSTTSPYSVEVSFTFTIDMFQKFFPVQTGSPIISGNAVYDINGNGMKEIIYGDDAGFVHVLNKYGYELAGFPFQTTGSIEGAPAIGDIDNDGDMEIVIGSKDKNLYVIQHDGSGSAIYTALGYLQASPSLIDFDNDGDLEIVAPSYGNDLVVVHHDGSNFGNFPIVFDNERMSKSAAVGDINYDGQKEIIVGTWGNTLHVFNADGSEWAGFPVLTDGRIVSDITVADLDNDGVNEIIFTCDANRIYAVNLDGSIKWMGPTDAIIARNSPAVGDIDGDGNLEIFFGAYDYLFYAYDSEGNELLDWPMSSGHIFTGSPVLADVDNDGLSEVFIGSRDGYVYGFDGDGSSLFGFPMLIKGQIKSTPTIVDMDGDGDVEIIFGTDSCLAVIDLKGVWNNDEDVYWSTHQGNIHRTGYYTAEPLDTKELEIKPKSFAIESVYPNPFNPTVNIQLAIPESGEISLRLFDLTGRESMSLPAISANAGIQRLSLDGSQLASGVYLLQVRFNDSIALQKVTLLK